MKNQYFGVEIELTGITRKKAAKVISEHFQKNVTYRGGCYYQYNIKDSKNRTWKVMRDSSINPQRKNRGNIVGADDEYRVEIVTPKCEYDDIGDIQEIVRKIRKEGAFANKSCGIHIHIDGSKHNPKTLRNITNIMASKQDLIYKALEVGNIREFKYCKKLQDELVKKVNKKKPGTDREFADIWYEGYFGSRSAHYNDSRYHGLNLHSFFTKGTVEFRLFNSTTHAGKIKAYIQFCLAVSHQALIQKRTSAKKTKTTNDKYTFRTWLLRLGLIGDEYKTCRLHMLANLEGDIAWRHVA